MRKLAAILLMGVLLFHWMGYQALYSYWMQQADDKLEARLDVAGYDEQDLLTIAIPLHLPYLTDQAAFERCNGEIAFNGITYKYVQRRVYHDSLFVQCLPNQEAMRLNAARNSCFRFAAGMQQSGSGFSKPGLAFAKYFTGGFPSLSGHQPIGKQPGGIQQFPAISQGILPRPACAGPYQPPEIVPNFFS